MMETYHLGLVGYPLEHSRSPAIHNSALAAASLVGEYRLYPVQPLPDGQADLCKLLSGLRTGKLTGLNITIPHKQAVIQYLDSLSPAAQTIGAVNTIFLQNDLLVGENTDAAGFLVDLARLTPDLCDYLRDEDRVALILGAGGAARAVVYALANADWRVIVAARRYERGSELALGINSRISDSLVSSIELSWDSLQKVIAGTDLISLVVNATPLGMYPKASTCPWPDGLSLPGEATVYDLVYNPVETTLVARAHSQGLRAFTGMGMLVEQAALAFEIWTGLPAPREVMRKAAERL